MVVGRAVIADLATGRAAARAFSLMMIVSGVAPVVAPLLGGLLVDRIHWRGVLAVLAGLAIAMLVGSAAIVRESLPRDRRGTARGGGLRMLRRTYLFATVTFVFSFAVLMAYISASPFLYQTVIGVSTVSYGLLFALNAFGLVLSSAGASRLLRTGDPRRVLTVGVAWLLIAVLVLLALFANTRGAAAEGRTQDGRSGANGVWNRVEGNRRGWAEDEPQLRDRNEDRHGQPGDADRQQCQRQKDERS